jgi:hypothetical protein
MKERPILFSGEMVRAILDGRKTQTRRVIKPQPDARGPRWCNQWEDWHGTKMRQPPEPGDQLWVREKHNIDKDEDGSDSVLYWADFEKPEVLPMKWRPSIHMPRWASRINLLVKDVRVERVQDIKLNDIEAEGIGGCSATEGLEQFIQLWESINGIKHRLDPYPWDTNPWVWVIEFERMN